MYLKKAQKAQSILEYVILICVILSALLIMQFYLKRSYQGRLKQESDTLGQQYSPGHTASLIETVTATYSVSYTGGQTDSSDLSQVPGLVPDAVDVPDGMTVTYAGTDTDTERREAVDSFATE